MKFTPGDICVNDASAAPGCILITALSPDPMAPYLGIDLVKKKHYRLKEELLVKIGHLTPELTVADVLRLVTAPPALPSTDSPEYLDGKNRADYEAHQGDPAWRPQWQILVQAKPGDAIPIHIDGKPETVTFHHVVERGEKFVFTAADRKGKVYRYPIEAVCLRDTQGKEHSH